MFSMTIQVDEVRVPPRAVGLELHGGPDNQDAESNYYMGGVNQSLVLIMDEGESPLSIGLTSGHTAW